MFSTMGGEIDEALKLALASLEYSITKMYL